MGMATATKHWTVAMLRELPDDGKRYELIDGDLYVNGVLAPGNDPAALDDVMTPSPSWTHQRAVGRLHARLLAFLTEHRAGDVIVAPADVEYADRTTVQPDLFVVPLVAGRPPRTWEEAGRLLLAVEVLSPSTARADRVVKRRLYQRGRVPEYWVVDVDARLVERWRPDDERPEVLGERLEWRPAPEHDPLVIDLVAYFAEVVGE
jgi:Uma2 family endonuclease